MGLIDYIFPIYCLSCGKEGKYICMECLNKVASGGFVKMDDFNVKSIWRYEGVIRKALISLKYKFSTAVAHELIENIDLTPGSGYLIPIPMYWVKKNQRGFNQAEILGRLLAGKMGWDNNPNILIKKISTKPQVGLKGENRRRNLRGTFEVNQNFPKFLTKPIIIFDDVLTTGSTIHEAALALKKVGITNVSGLTIAR